MCDLGLEPLTKEVHTKALRTLFEQTICKWRGVLLRCTPLPTDLLNVVLDYQKPTIRLLCAAHWCSRCAKSQIRVETIGLSEPLHETEIASIISLLCRYRQAHCQCGLLPLNPTIVRLPFLPKTDGRSVWTMDVPIMQSQEFF
jgi:hypothetical protein